MATWLSYINTDPSVVAVTCDSSNFLGSVSNDIDSYGWVPALFKDFSVFVDELVNHLFNSCTTLSYILGSLCLVNVLYPLLYAIE